MTNGSLSKRRFISGAVAAFGLNASQPVAKAYAETLYDLIVMGGGTAGLACAVSAAEKGASVLLIEKADRFGGTLFLSGGSIAAAGTRLQERKGIKDSPDMHFADIMKLGHNKGDPSIIRRYVDSAAEMVDWLEVLGFEAAEGQPTVGGGGHAPFSVARYFGGSEGGRSLVKVLLPALQKHTMAGLVKALVSTTVAELVIGRDKSVQGVIAVSAGQRTKFSARKVVIASGGYCYSPEMFKRVTGYKLHSRGAFPMNVGEGLLLGESAGGFVRGGEHQIFGPGSIVKDRNYPSEVQARPQVDHNRRPQWEIQVNALGQRYVREDHPEPDLRDKIFTKQPTGRIWIVFDQYIWENAPFILAGMKRADIEPLFNFHPMYFKGATVEELAVRASLDPENLKRTVEEYNIGVRTKTDSLGRTFLPAEIAQSPFYAMEVSGWNLVGFGGLATNAEMQILRADGGVVQNLYAAGEVVGLAAICGDLVVGGSAITASLTFGRIVGQSALGRT